MTRTLAKVVKGAVLSALICVSAPANPAFADGLLKPAVNAAHSRFALAPSRSVYRNPALRVDGAFGGGFSNDNVSSGNVSGNNASGDEFGDRSFSESPDNSHGVSSITAVALSALLPGAGQWYLGKRRTARLFFGAEAAVWAGFAAMKVNANWKQDEVERFATRHAGVSGLNREERFFEQLKFYPSREVYNTLGRAFDPSLPFIADTPENDWNWDSPESQKTFRQLFNDQNSAERNANFMFIAAAVNRLASAALAWRSAKKMNNRLDENPQEFGDTSPAEPRMTFRLVQPSPGHNGSDGLMLAFTRSF